MSLLLALTGGGSSVTGTAATSQAQTVASDGSFTAAGIVTGGAVTSQAQTASATGSATVPAVAGTLITSQAQTVAATGTASPAAVSGTLSANQAQTTALAGSASPATVSGTGTTSQGQTSAASGSFAGSSGVSGVASTSQGQTVSSSGSVVNPELAGFNGGFDMSRPRKVYIKRGKQYLIFNNNEEADSYLAAEKAIETAKKSSRGAAKRVIKALKVVKPEIAPEPKLEELSALIAKFDFKYDLPQLAKNNDIEALYQIQSMLYALQQDEEDIELLLLAL
jgi:hypothetical protein